MHHKLFASVLHLMVMAGVITGACACLPGNLAPALVVLAMEHLVGLAWSQDLRRAGHRSHGGSADTASGRLRSARRPPSAVPGGGDGDE